MFRADPEKLAHFLKNESPQTISLLLYSLPPIRSAALLEKMPLELQSDILYAIAHLDELNPDANRDLLKAASEILGSTPLDLGLKMANAIKTAVDIFQNLSPEIQRKLWENLEAAHPDLSEKMLQIIQHSEGNKS